LRRSRRVVVALSIAVLVTLVSGASATPGPGGWDNVGSAGTPAAPALNGATYALNVDSPAVLYAGGAFTDAGGDPGADYLARWNGTAWSAVGAPALNGAVHAIAYRGGKVYVGGVFTNAGGNPDLDFLAVWDGTRWGSACTSTAPGSAIGGTVLALQIIGSTLYVGGAFQNGAGIATADYLVACDLSTGAASSTVTVDGDFSGAVYALTADSSGALYAGGGFINLARIPAADKVAYFAGGTWHAMGSGPSPGLGAVDDFVRSLTSDGRNVYIGTDAKNVAGLAQADHVARWNGSDWSAVGSNTSGGDGWFPASTTIDAMATSGSRVFASGSFQNANGDPLADFVAWYDGSAWHPVGSNGAGNGALNGFTGALATSGTRFYAGGTFTNAGGNPLARFLASFAFAGLTAPGGGGGGGTPPASGSAPPATGAATGTVTVNGRPFTSGQIPYKSKIDVTNGTLLLKTDTGSVRLFGSGVFAKFQLLRGTDRKKAIVELRLIEGNFAVCKRKTSSALATTTVVRQLWGNGKGRFRTRGRYSAATVRGTFWLTADRCDGTQTRVNRGVIEVSDFPLRKLVTIRAGKTYLAKP
jgi:hypothetical protein